MLRFNIIEGPSQSIVVEIPKTAKATVGRKLNNFLSFPDGKHLSNIHSTISYIEGKFYIEDMITTNGTW